MEMPLVSIIIPAYNAERHIAGCVRSALRQSFPEIEVCVVDDCSTDNTAMIVREMMAKHPNLHIHSNPHNMGPYHSRLEGVRHSKGDYIMFMDADDTLHPRSAEELHRCIHAAGCDIAVMGAKYSFFNGMLRIPFSIPSRAYDQASYGKQQVLSELMPLLVGKRGVTCSMCDKMYSRSLFTNSDFIGYDGHCGEDLVCNFQIFSRAEGFAVTDFPGYLWRYTGGNLKYSTRMWEDLQQTYPVLHKLIDATADTEPAWREQMHDAVEMSRLADLNEAVIQRLCVMHQPRQEVLDFVRDQLHSIEPRYFVQFCKTEDCSAAPEKFVENSQKYFRNHRKFYNFMRLMQCFGR